MSAPSTAAHLASAQHASAQHASAQHASAQHASAQHASGQGGSHAHGHGGHGDDHPLVGHLVPFSTLFGVAAILLVMTFLTVAARWVDIGEFNIALAMFIATIKATLVALYFMHLRWDRPFNILTFVGSIAFVGLFMALALIDTHAYELEKETGNPVGVVTILDEQAPGAPIAEK